MIQIWKLIRHYRIYESKFMFTWNVSIRNSDKQFWFQVNRYDAPSGSHRIRKSFPMVPVFLLMLFDEFQILFTPIVACLWYPSQSFDCFVVKACKTIVEFTHVITESSKEALYTWLTIFGVRLDSLDTWTEIWKETETIDNFYQLRSWS